MTRANVGRALGWLSMPKGMPVRSGRILYRRSGYHTGTRTLVWADYGRKCREQITEKSLRLCTIRDGRDTYQWGGCVPARQAQRFRASGEYNPGWVSLRFGLHAFAEVEFLGKGAVLGRECVIYFDRARGAGPMKLSEFRPQTRKVWLWQGLCLRSHGWGNGRETREIAVKLDTSPRLSARLFKPPAGYKIVERTNR